MFLCFTCEKNHGQSDIVNNDYHIPERKEINYSSLCKLLSFPWDLLLSTAPLRLYQIPTVGRYLTHNYFPFSGGGSYTSMCEMAWFVLFGLALGHG